MCYYAFFFSCSTLGHHVILYLGSWTKYSLVHMFNTYSMKMYFASRRMPQRKLGEILQKVGECHEES